MTHPAQTVALAPPAATESPGVLSRYGLLLATAALIAITALPHPDGLPVAGQNMLAILAFAVIIWMTEAVSYPVSAILITTLTAFMLGLSPDVANPKAMLGTAKGLSIALNGFSNTAWALVGGALFLGTQLTANSDRIGGRGAFRVPRRSKRRLASGTSHADTAKELLRRWGGCQINIPVRTGGSTQVSIAGRIETALASLVAQWHQLIQTPATRLRRQHPAPGRPSSTRRKPMP